MKKLLAALTLALLLSVGAVSGVASASHDPDDFQSAVNEMRAVDPTLNPPPNAGKHDFVVGGFQGSILNNSLSAHSDPLGRNVHGFETNTTYPGGDFKYRQRVTCLVVDGNVAAYGLIVTHSASNTVPPGTEYVEVVRDSGLPGGEGDGWASYPTRAQNCPLFIEFAPFAFPIERGNILVHDAELP